MYKTMAEAKAFAEEFKKLYGNTDVKAAICAPFPQLALLVEAFKGTGIGVDYCIIGHSERRQYFNESDETVNMKLKALLETDITPIVCVGEDLVQREKGYQDQLVSEQVENAFRDIPAEKAEKAVIAYEPIWAIGTGRTATPVQANMMCALIRETLIEMYGDETADKIIIQYGGSVKPENATDIMNMEEIDGALVGGASLEPLKFIEIVNF